MRRFFACSIAVATLSVATVVDTSAATRNAQVTRQIPFAPGGTLRLKNFSGPVNIRGNDTSEVVIVAGRRGSTELLNRVELAISVIDTVIDINANHLHVSSSLDGKSDSRNRNTTNNVVETAFNITVPRNTNLDIEVFESPLNVNNVEGHHNLRTFTSNLRLANLGGTTAIRSFKGNVRLDLNRWDNEQSLSIETFNGDVAVRVPSAARGNVAFETRFGRLTSNMPWGVHDGTNANPQLASTMRFKTFSGDIRINR